MIRFTIKDFKTRFSTEESCIEELMHKRYGKEGKCDDCHKTTKFHRVKGRKCYECQWCGFQVYPTAGTIFNKSATPLADWFYVMYLMTATHAGISAKEVQRQLGVTYKTAWRMCHQIKKITKNIN